MRALLAVLLATPALAHACLFLKDVPQDEWLRWSTALYAGEVIKVERHGQDDVIEVRVTETFKGPEGSVATVRMPSRMWASCRMARPALGARVLVAFHANGDAAIVPQARPATNGARRQPDGPPDARQ